MTREKLFKDFGSKLVRAGHKMLRSAFNVKYDKTDFGKIKRVVKDYVSDNMLYGADTNYWTTDWDTFQNIIHYDWVNKKKYLSEHYDCDDFSNSFKSHMAEIYGITAVALARTVELKSATSGNHLGWHRCNVILATENGALKAFLFEPERDAWTELKHRPIIGKWEYNLDRGWLDI